MADDRGKRRPHRDYGRPPSAIPVEVDPELTPPPREPPTAAVLGRLPIESQVSELRSVVAEQGAAIGRVWDARHISGRLERLETTVAQDTHRVGQLIVAVEHWGETSRKAFDKSLANAEEQIRVGAQLVGIFNKLTELVDEVKSFNASVDSIRDRVADAEQRLEIVETKQAEQGAAIIDLNAWRRERDQADRDKQVSTAAVVKERHRWLNWINAAKVAAGIVIAIASYLAGSNL